MKNQDNKFPQKPQGQPGHNKPQGGWDPEKKQNPQNPHHNKDHHKK